MYRIIQLSSKKYYISPDSRIILLVKYSMDDPLNKCLKNCRIIDGFKESDNTKCRILDFSNSIIERNSFPSDFHFVTRTYFQTLYYEDSPEYDEINGTDDDSEDSLKLFWNLQQ